MKTSKIATFEIDKFGAYDQWPYDKMSKYFQIILAYMTVMS